jgi:drug/metabolite transporter (DMT)-like permease
MTALWAVVIIVNKRTLEYVSPLALNFFLRGVSAIGLVALTVPLTVLGLWSNGFGSDWAAAGYIAVSSVVTWLIAFSTYYYALRVGKVSVVAPIASTDPVWTALFAFAILGAAIGAPTLLGLVVVMTGVVLISRWMEDEPDVTVDALGGPAFEPGAATTAGGGATSRAAVIVLSLVTAAGWGLGPILIDLASQAYGRVTATMMIESQLLGMLFLGAIILVRRTPLTPHALPPGQRRVAVRLIAVTGVLETFVTVLFYLCVQHIGPVLTMLIMATTPVFAIAFGFVALGERVRARLVVAALVTLAGVLLAVLEGVL